MNSINFEYLDFTANHVMQFNLKVYQAYLEIKLLFTGKKAMYLHFTVIAYYRKDYIGIMHFIVYFHIQAWVRSSEVVSQFQFQRCL